MAEAIRVKHLTLRSCVALIECRHKPLRPLAADGSPLYRPCPLCRSQHEFKTVHLWLDDAGTALVSTGVLEDLQKAGMPDLAIVGTAVAPPLAIGEDRGIVDSRNRRITRWEPIHA